MNQLAQTNQIQNPNLIVVGQRLHLNGSQAAAAQPQATQQPVQQQTQAVQSAPAPAPVQAATASYQAPAAQPQVQAPQAPVQTQAPAATASYQAPALGGNEQAAKDWIASRESGGNYNATNGQYIGKYQLSASYLNGDYSPANQERVANNYVQSRYGSWTAAQSFWQAHGWY